MICLLRTTSADGIEEIVKAVEFPYSGGAALRSLRVNLEDAPIVKSHWSSPCFAIAAVALGLQIASPPVLAQASAHDHRLQPHASTLRHAGSASNVIIGAAADPRHFDETEYESTLVEQFDQLEPENQMKFQDSYPGPEMSRAPTISLQLIASWISPRYTIGRSPGIASSGTSRFPNGS